MNSRTRQYLFGGIFVAVAVYQAYLRDFVEFSLYLTAGMAFIVNALALEPRMVSVKRPLVIATWILISAAAVQFLYVLQFKF